MQCKHDFRVNSFHMLSMVKIRQISRASLVMNLCEDRADRRIQKPVKHLRLSATCFGKTLHLRCFTGFRLHLYRLISDMNGMLPVNSFNSLVSVQMPKETKGNLSAIFSVLDVHPGSTFFRTLIHFNTLCPNDFRKVNHKIFFYDLHFIS